MDGLGRTPTVTTPTRSALDHLAADLGLTVEGFRESFGSIPAVRQLLEELERVGRSGAGQGWAVEILCADCGCVMDRGRLIKPCRTPGCCCENIAAEPEAAPAAPAAAPPAPPAPR